MTTLGGVTTLGGGTSGYTTLNVALKIVTDDGNIQIWGNEVAGEEMSEEAQEFQRLSERINNTMNNQNMFNAMLRDYTPGQVCLGRRVQDKIWYRVRLIDVIGTTRGQQAKCLLLDYAETEMIPCSWLRESPHKFLEIPYQAKEFVLYKIQPCTLQTNLDLTVTNTPCKQWDPSAEKFIRDQVKAASSAHVELRHVEKGLFNSVKHQALIFINSNGETTCLNDLLVQRGYAMSKDHIEPVDLATDSPFTVGGARKDSMNLAPKTQPPPSGPDVSVEEIPGLNMEGLTAEQKRLLEIALKPHPGSYIAAKDQ
ncbi:unnamed protein product, partial [Owenia fusiformis]